MKKRFLATALALAMLLMMVPSAFAASDGFDDVSGHWAEDAINRWSGYGVVNGVGDNQFAPNGTLTRAQAAQVFANLLDLEVQADISRYTDVPEGSWYHTAIAQCVAAGILTGTGGATMDPQSPVTREELFVMFARALNIRPQSSSDVTFGDSGEVSGWAQGYINALADRGFVSGVGGGMLAPGEAINRASVMSLLDKTISDYANTSGTTVGNASGVVLVVADNASVAGDVDTLVVYGGSASVTGSQVAEATVAGENASLSVSGSAVVERVDVAGTEAVLTLTGSVRAGQVTVSGESAQVSLSGQAQAASVAVEETAAGAGLTVGAGSAVTTVDSAAANVTISGSGTVETANVSGNNTTVNTDGTDLTVAQGTTGVTENDKPVSGGTTVETQPEQPSTPVIPPVHVHDYAVATEIKAADDETVIVGVRYDCSSGDAFRVQMNGSAVAMNWTRQTYYVDLQNAINAAEPGDELELLKENYTLDSQLVINKAISFYGNDKTITRATVPSEASAADSAAILVSADGVTISCLNVSGPNSTTTGWDEGEYGIKVYDAENVTLDSVTVSGANAGILVSSSNVMLEGTIIVTDNEFGGIEVSKSSNEGLSAGSLDISGATVVCTDKGIPAIWIDGYNATESESGGTVTGAENLYTMVVKDGAQLYYFTSEDLAVFAGAVSSIGNTMYSSLADAIAAAKDGDTVTLLENVILTEALSITKGIILDGNENTITANIEGGKAGNDWKSSVKFIDVDTNKNLTIRDCVFAFDQPIRTPLSLNVGGVVTITGNTFNCGDQMCYNPIEFGIGSDYAPASGTIVSDNIFNGRFYNNGISFYNLVANGVYTISGNTFEFAGNGLRLSNPKNVSATFNVENNTYNGTLSGDFAGFLIFEDYGEATAHQDLTVLTVNITNLVGPNGVVMKDNITNGQVYYVYSDHGGGLDCSKLDTAKPTVNFN